MDSRDGHIYPCGYRGDEDMGASVAELRKSQDNPKPFCKICLWECFMDPSQLFGIFRHVIRRPFNGRFKKAPDRQMLRLWFGDMKYYLACGFFDGRKPLKRRRKN
jgi:hypothetical protein